MTKQTINSLVNITKIGFRRNMSAYPMQMEYLGNVYDFIDTGIHCLVRRGESVSEILTLSDGMATFRLRSDNRGNDWTLLSIMA